MQDISYPHVRQVLINDRPICDRPDRRYLLKITHILPDVLFHGFGRLYDGTWYLILESRMFPYHIESIGARGAIAATSLINYLPKKSTPNAI